MDSKIDFNTLDFADDLRKFINFINIRLGEIISLNESACEKECSFILKDRNEFEIIEEKVREAERYYGRPIDSKETYKKLALISDSIGDKKSANDWLARIKNMDAAEFEFQGRMQKFYGNHTAALELFAKSLELKPDFKDAKIGYESSKKGILKSKKVLPRYEELVKNSPDNAKAWYNRGIALASLGELERALESFEKAISIDDKFLEPWIKKGTTLESMGKFKESLICFEKALTINPKSMNAIRGKNYAQYNLGMF